MPSNIKALKHFRFGEPLPNLPENRPSTLTNRHILINCLKKITLLGLARQWLNNQFKPTMSFNNFKNYGDSPQNAFETFCTQLFERYLRRKHGSNLVKFRVVNGAGGDGGIEAYGELANGDIIAVQAKWFPTNMEDSQIRQIRKSVDTALKVRKKITEYIICVPRSLNSAKMGKGQVPVSNTEESRADALTSAIQTAYPNTTFTWWFEQDLEFQIQEIDNEGIHRFWFDKELVTLKLLIQQFGLEKKAWIDKRYIPELHGSGIIQSHIRQILYDQDYRKDLLDRLNDIIKVLQSVLTMIPRFTETLPVKSPLTMELNALQDAINYNLGALLPIVVAIQEGVSTIPTATFDAMPISQDLLSSIRKIKPSDRQLGVQRRLVDTLMRIKELDLQAVIQSLVTEANQTSRLFLGKSGTGKTHALANTVDVRLNRDNAPAIIIRAKGAPSSDWTLLLKKALDLDGWNRNEILSALETLAVRADRRDTQQLPIGEEIKREGTKVIICIDGLEEDTENWPEWYSRMRESIELISRYPRVRFVYTARPYFLDQSEVPKDSSFRVIEIPQEGDVTVYEVMDQYFSPEHFNIKVEPRSLIRGIDSLYALRLFCELYEGQTLTADSDILTAERDLLNEKIHRIERDFRNIKNAGQFRAPVRDAIETFSEVFYNQAEMEHNELFSLLNSGSLSYLQKEDVENVIEYLVNNGFLSKSEIPIGTSILRKNKISYSLTYQSIMELIMSERYTAGIVAGELLELPEHLISTTELSGNEGSLVKERIVQQIVNSLFHDHGKLIGRNNFLTGGLDPATVHQLQTRALIQAPPDVAETYKTNINTLYFKDHKSRYFAFSNLIFPSAISAGNFFGAEYLHGLLMQQPTAVDRDKIWLGLDRLDIHQLGEPDSRKFYRYDLSNVIDPYGEGPLHLPEFALHNEYPLIYGWALSTLDQSLRARLRISLTDWAIRQPHEFKLLLDKLFPVNDPQIQEDLASIALGVVSQLKDKDSLKELAEWALSHVFVAPGSHPNIIVRMGFRVVVEKAHLAGALSVEDIEKARPHKVDELVFIPVDKDALETGDEEIYPIVHDLAWYVIERSFDDFMDYGSVEPETDPKNAREHFLKAYLDHLGLGHLNAYSWAISSAIAYMKSLGFSRTKDNGNGFTDATHGSKSKHFTLEEKYTWLAVHHLQAYLSDYLPLEKSGEFIDDYIKISNIDNPAESLQLRKHPDLPDIEDNWIIKESLAPEMTDASTFDEQIKVAVDIDPVINFHNWLEFKDHDFKTTGNNDEWLALYNNTTVHDSMAYISSRIDARGVLIEKGQAAKLLDIVSNHQNRSHFVEHIDRMVGSPDTDTYSNPSDIVWMAWIGEIEEKEEYYLPPNGEEKEMLYTVTSVTRQTVDGEDETYIPSKKVRDLMGISEMSNQIFLDNNDKVIAINHSVRRSNYDSQEITVVLKAEFLSKIEENNLEIVWFVDLFRSKNALNDKIKSDQHPMKTRKYFVWFEEGKLRAEKFWDARFSNQRDKDPNEPKEQGDED